MEDNLCARNINALRSENNKPSMKKGEPEAREQTSMRDHLLVQVLQPLKKLIHDILSFGFAHLIACLRSAVNICEKISASTQLKKYVTLLITIRRRRI